MIPELVILIVTLCLLALSLVFLVISRPALEIICQSDAPSRKIPVRGNNASPGWITSTSRRLAVAVMVAATVAAADVVAIAVAAALAAQRNMNGDSFVR
jgi:hypothetical protein